MKKVLTKAIWVDKKWLVSGRLACKLYNVMCASVECLEYLGYITLSTTVKRVLTLLMNLGNQLPFDKGNKGRRVVQ